LITVGPELSVGEPAAVVQATDRLPVGAIEPAEPVNTENPDWPLSGAVSVPVTVPLLMVMAVPPVGALAVHPVSFVETVMVSVPVETAKLSGGEKPMDPLWPVQVIP
jgi:hypothetical protein